MASKQPSRIHLPSKTAHRDSEENGHKVPVKMWAKWPNAARRAFNNVMEDMEEPTYNAHPKMPALDAEHWDTIRWNAACHAAFQVAATIS